ncbi:hypothetical protein [Tsuneonella sp. SYSU-LHT278]|uniref:hypothetical protein n=1 Tax=Tsuneonella sediminis TaxID=3416089 RepID=UPI003F79210B
MRQIIRTVTLATCLVGVPVLGQSAGAAPSDCRVRVNATPAAWIIRGYDPYESTLPESTFSVTFTNDGAQECRFTPVFQLDDPPIGMSSGVGRTIGYSLINLSDARDVTPRNGRPVSSGDRRQIVLGASGSHTVMYKLVATEADVSRSGTFTQNVTLEAQDASLRVLGGTPVLLGLEVLPSARIGLAGAYRISDGHALVSLGELRKGPAPVPLQLRVNSTGRYDLDVTSLNGGNLRLGSSGWKVPYSIAIGGTKLNLSGTGRVSGPSDDGLTRAALPIHFVIGDVSDRPAGRYSDLISISVTAR